MSISICMRELIALRSDADSPATVLAISLAIYGLIERLRTVYPSTEAPS